MKKFLYIFSMFIMALTFFVGCACSERENETERLLRLYDLNENGVIDFWEQPFENKKASTREIDEDFTVHNIDSEEKFLAISNSEDNSPEVVYRLTKDLDFSETALAEPVDFGGAILYGNNKSIYKFTLDNTATNFEYALIKGASAVYDTNFYLGIQLSQSNYGAMSALSNVAEIDNVSVRGYFSIVHTSDLNLSFLLTGSTPSKISNVNIEGVLNTSMGSTSINSSSIFNFGGVASTLSIDSEVTNASVYLKGEVDNGIGNFIGGLAGVSEGFIEDSYSTLKLQFTVDDEAKGRMGGAVGLLLDQGEIKHTVSDVDILATRTDDLSNNDYILAIGGLVGESYGSLFYNESKGDIEVFDVAEVSVGGMIGSSYNTYALRNISKVNLMLDYQNEMLSSPQKPKMYIAGFAGNAVKGVFESCISVGDIELNLVNSETKPAVREINLGLFFFHSSYFKDIYSVPGMSEAKAKENDTLIDEENMQYPNYSPSLTKNIVQGNISINDGGAGVDIINYGGYWWWIITGINTANPETFEVSSSFGSTISHNGKDNTSQFFPDRMWLERKNLAVSDLGSKFGILPTESNYQSITSLKELEFKNSEDLKGSYYKSKAVINSKTPNKYDFHATNIEQLEYLATYLLGYRNTITFEVDNADIKAEEGFNDRVTDIKENKLVFASKTVAGEDGEEDEVEYFVFTKPKWDGILNQPEYDRILSQDLEDEYGITNELQYIIIEQILNVAGSVNVTYRRIKGDTEDDKGVIYFTYKKPGTTSNQIIKLDISHTLDNEDSDYTRYTMYFVGEA